MPWSWATERERIRLAYDQLLTETVTVLRATDTPDGYGGQTRTWATVGTTTGLVARVRLTPDYTIMAERAGVRTLRSVMLPYDAPVQVGDRLQVAGRDYLVLAALHGTYAVGQHWLVGEEG